MSEKKERVILCPICEKGKFIDVCNSRGINSIICSVCCRAVEINWDTMTARKGDRIKNMLKS